jgi:hypothetical protein
VRAFAPQNASLRARRALKLQILKLCQMQFGTRSEKRAREIEQLELWVEQLEEAATQRSSALAEQAAFPACSEYPKPRREFPAHLARETQTIAPHESSCPDRGGELKHLGEDVSVACPVRLWLVLMQLFLQVLNVGADVRALSFEAGARAELTFLQYLLGFAALTRARR